MDGVTVPTALRDFQLGSDWGSQRYLASVILPAVTNPNDSIPRGGEYCYELTADSTSHRMIGL